MTDLLQFYLFCDIYIINYTLKKLKVLAEKSILTAFFRGFCTHPASGYPHVLSHLYLPRLLPAFRAVIGL